MMMLILVVLLVALLIPLTAVVLDSQVGRAIAGRLERGRDAVSDGTLARLAALESEVDRLTREVERLDEESTFLQRLLEKKRPDDDRQLPPGEQQG
jgi:hypothetical protein